MKEKLREKKCKMRVKEKSKKHQKEFIIILPKAASATSRPLRRTSSFAPSAVRFLCTRHGLSPFP